MCLFVYLLEKLQYYVIITILCSGAQLFSRVQLLVILWTIDHQVPLSLGFFRQEYWNGLPFPPPGYLPDPGIEPVSLVSPALAGGFSTTASPGTQFVSILLMLTLIT